MKQDTTKHNHITILRSGTTAFIAVTTFFAVGVLIWVLLDERLPFWDEAYHLNRTLAFTAQVRDFPATLSSLYNNLTGYPPLVYLMAIPLAFINSQPWFMRLINVVFLYLLSIGLFQIAKNAAGPKLALLAVLFSLSLPELAYRQRVFYLDAPLAAMTTLSLSILINANTFENRKWSVLFGISFGLSMLVKWTVFLFLAVPIVIKLLELIKLSGKKVSKNLLNYFLGILISLAIALPWYLVFFKSVLGLLRINTGTGYYAVSRHIYDPASLWYYLKVFIDNTTWPLIIAILMGLFLAIKNRWLPGRTMIFSYLISGFFLLVLIENKQPRFFLPLLVILPVFAVLTFVYRSDFARLLFITQGNNDIYPADRKTDEREGFKTLFNRIFSQASGKKTALLIASDTPPVEYFALLNYTTVNHLENVILYSSNWQKKKSPNLLLQAIREKDFIITVTPSTGPWFSTKYIKQIKENIPAMIEMGLLRKMDEIKCGNKTIQLYKVLET